MGLFDRLMQPQAPRRNLMDTQMVRRPSEERVLLDEFYPPDYSKLKRGQFRQDTPQMREYAANVPVDVGRGTLAGLFGLASDTLNFAPAYSPMPMEQFGDYNYAPSQKVPYGSEYFLENLPLAPAADNPLGRVAGQLGSFAPMVPVQAARIAGKGAAATAKFVAPKAGQLAEGYMQRMGMMPGIVPAEGGLLTPSVKPQAPVSDLGFYSAAKQAALNLQRNKGTGQSFINDLMKAPDVKKEELAWTGLDEFLANKPNVTKQEVQDYLAGNRVDLQERQLSGRGDKFGVFSEFNPDKNQFMVYGEDLSHTHAFDTAEEADNFVKQFNSQIPYGPSKYDKYQLPGGENYREILLTLPEKTPKTLPEGYSLQSMANGNFTLVNPDNIGTIIYASSKDDAMKEAIRRFTRKEDLYQSSHFNEPNILAHIRVNDRIDADGKKMLLIEELQSDWHQAGREKGYKGQLKDLPNDYKVQSKTDKDGYAYYEVLDPQGNVFAKDYSKGSVTNQAINRLNETVGGVPDAPFKDTWHQLALKRALKYAADNGYERVGLTTGAQQAKRYDLSKQVDEIAVPMVNADGSRSVRIEPTEGSNIKLMVDSNGVVTGYGSGSTQFSGKKLDEVLGKEIADKVMNAQASAKFSGLDLQVGGEGMKKYYDEIYPAFLAKQGKKFNAKTGETRIKTGQGIPGGAPVRYIDISPEMKSGVSKGQPMFAAAPIAGVGLGAGQQQQPADILTNELDYPSNPMYTDPLGYSIR